MKSLLAISGAVLSAVMFSACLADQPAEDDDPGTEQAATPDESGQFISVPPELSFTRPEGTYDGNTFTAHANTCHVTLRFCRDPNHSNLPSFCQNGGCTVTRATNVAISLCHSICGNVSCDGFYQYPNSSSC